MVQVYTSRTVFVKKIRSIKFDTIQEKYIKPLQNSLRRNKKTAPELLQRAGGSCMIRTQNKL